MNTDELIDSVVVWGKSHGITNPDKQTAKLMEECGELAHEICRSRYNSDELKDAIGDIVVVVTILADMLGIDIRDCYQMAYDTISKRDGESVNGCFIKAND